MKGNVILFPDLEKKLLIKGVESLQEKNYRQAIQYLEEALDLDCENDEIYIGLVLSYYETGAYQEAKKMAKKMLSEGIGDYFQTVDLYLMIMIQLHEYEELTTFIEALLEENEIPEDKQVHLINMLHFYQRIMQEGNDTPIEENTQYQSDMNLQSLFEEEDIYKQMLLLSELTNRNIRPYIPEIEQYLINTKENPFIKTIVLNILHEQQYDKEIDIEKFGDKKTVIPTELFSLHEQPQLLAIIEELQKQLENEDPVLYENTRKLVERQLFIMYPFVLQPSDPKRWAYAYQIIANEYMGKKIPIHDIEELTYISEDEIENSLRFIRNIEKISSPIF